MFDARKRTIDGKPSSLGFSRPRSRRLFRETGDARHEPGSITAYAKVPLKIVKQQA
jgi:hypothetical protein